MTNNKHKEIMETELKEWEGKEIFTLGDKECLPMLKNSLKRVLTEQLEELEGWVEGEIKTINYPEGADYLTVEALKSVLSHIREQKEIINKK